jgi:hypothetical protein
MPDLTAFLVAVGPLAIMVTKTVDTLRNLTPDTDRKWVWNIAAFTIGVAYCLLFGMNLAGEVAFQPAVAGALTGVWGQVLTGLAIGATASFWHEQLDRTSSRAKEARANAAATAGAASSN